MTIVSYRMGGILPQVSGDGHAVGSLSVYQLPGLPVCQADGGNSIGRVFHAKPSGAYILATVLK